MNLSMDINKKGTRNIASNTVMLDGRNLGRYVVVLNGDVVDSFFPLTCGKPPSNDSRTHNRTQKASMTKSYPANAGIPTIRSWMPSTPQPVPREALPYSACFAL